ncbi:hypothetical protein CI238_11124 [Colletotrichum incanum]|uniref:Uncharacterized protein n=1 Tax=Colletotrichum incanum TaxID=1573173 RepID=A0A166VXT1_COLIC|nr:hypothetical protein CI238_11124 [Colletotrichum incanum]
MLCLLGRNIRSYRKIEIKGEILEDKDKRSYIKAKKPCNSVLVASTHKKEEAAGKELLRLYKELA